MNRKTCA